MKRSGNKLLNGALRVSGAVLSWGAMASQHEGVLSKMQDALYSEIVNSPQIIQENLVNHPIETLIAGGLVYGFGEFATYFSRDSGQKKYIKKLENQVSEFGGRFDRLNKKKSIGYNVLSNKDKILYLEAFRENDELFYDKE